MQQRKHQPSNSSFFILVGNEFSSFYWRYKLVREFEKLHAINSGTAKANWWHVGITLTGFPRFSHPGMVLCSISK